MPICPSCGSDNQGESNYCSKCGFEIYSATGRISPDTLLEGRYLIVETIGRGGMGAVYKALDTRLKNTPVAVKEMSTNALGQGKLKEAVDAFEKEAAMLLNLKHQALPRILDFFTSSENRWYLVMDYIDGETLEEVATKRGPIPETELIDWAKQLCEVLDYIHNQKPPVIFRDLKPSNIMLTNNNEIKLIDFGIARHFKPDTTSDTSHYASLGFSPPEQYGQKQTDARSDIYSLGVTMHYLLTVLDPGKSPFHFTPPIDYGFGSSKLSAVIMKAVNVNPDDRFQTVEDMIEQIGSIPFEKQEEIDTKTAAIPNEKLKPMSDRLSKKTEFLNLKPAKNLWSKKVKILAAALVVLITLLFAGYYLAINYYPISGISLDVESLVAALDAEYYIDYKNGNIPLVDLPIGARVGDPSWEWEFRNGTNYSGSGEVKPVIWIVVAKDHYYGLEPHVTLLSEDLIGLHAFDNSIDVPFLKSGYNHWGDSGTGKATRGVRPWLNSTGIHSGEGFYQAFSASFKRAVLTTTVPNREWKSGSAYSTSDNVFIPSTTELGDTAHRDTYQIGTAYSYFQGAGPAKRVARIGGEPWWYWTRSPYSRDDFVRYIDHGGQFYWGTYLQPYNVRTGVRPALNLKSGIFVSEIRD